MNQDRLWELVSLKLAGEATPEELTELKEWLQREPVEGLKWETMSAFWDARHPPLTSQKEAYNRHLQRLSNHLSEPVLQYEIPEAQEPELSSEPVLKKSKYR